MSRPEHVTADLLVIGGGMAGMSAAAYAARAGAEVIVLERSGSVGGSAALSNATVWAPTSIDLMLEEDPNVERELAEAVVAETPEGIRWLDGLGVVIEPDVKDLLRPGFGVGAVIDIRRFFDSAAASVESAAGWVVRRTEVVRLTTEHNVVTGAVATGADGEVTIRSRWTLLATGGFQASESAVAQCITRGPALLLRSNQMSDGAGIRLGLAVGAALRKTRGFYGHTLPHPLARELRPSEYVDLAQFHSERCVVVNKSGRRFVDESLQDHIVAQELVRQPESVGVLVCDQRITEAFILTPFVSVLEGGIDKLAAGRDAGARYAEANTLEALVEKVAGWGYARRQLAETLSSYNRFAEEERDQLNPPRLRHAHALTAPPFRALEIQPAITFTYTGLRIDTAARVLNLAGRPVSGLLAAGADASLYNRGYAGGLAPALVFGLRAGVLAARDATA